MKDEPQLIDIFAMFALNALLQGFKGESVESVAEASYDYAFEMMKVRKHFVKESEDE